jgi:hypothetical protein
MEFSSSVPTRRETARVMADFARFGFAVSDD